MGQGGEILGSEAGIDSRTYCRSANASDFRFGVNSRITPWRARQSLPLDPLKPAVNSTRGTPGERPGSARRRH